jgi:UDP-N-acetylglucosamine 2-epimerase
MKILTVVGARPQFIKAAPLGRALRQAGHREYLVHTGQHYDDAMADVFFRELELPRPDVNLEVGSGTHAYQTAHMLLKLEPIVERERPDWVLVYGDTNSTLAGALVASKLHVPLAHVEAGMRSDNRMMPEEINRVLADHASDLLLCATRTSVENLRREGIVRGVHLVGDVMLDALRMFLPVARKRSRILESLGIASGGYALMTAHRAETVDSDERLKALIARVGGLGLPVVFPVHPRTLKRLEALNLLDRLPESLRVVPPVGYLDMLVLEAEARVVLTDSGGVQREAFFLSVPSIILRTETEWPELVDTGSSVLAGEDFAAVTFGSIPTSPDRNALALFGDGRASAKIVGILAAAEPASGVGG